MLVRGFRALNVHCMFILIESQHKNDINKQKEDYLLKRHHKKIFDLLNIEFKSSY